MSVMNTSNIKELDYDFLSIGIEKGIATITLDNQPVNALSGRMMQELHRVLHQLAKDPSVKVIVFDSADSNFFIAHVDINILDDKEILDELASTAPAGLNIFQAMGELIRNQPQVTIVKLKGIARGGGAEFVAAADMSFASVEKGKLAQCEALMGIIPGGGATQYLSSRMTRGRALEIILGADLLDATTAERYGWINRAIPNSEIDEFVSRLAQNIAQLPEGVIQTVKNVLPPQRNNDGYKDEHDGWSALAFTPITAQIMRSAMQNGAQTVEGELDLEKLLRSIV